MGKAMALPSALVLVLAALTPRLGMPMTQAQSAVLSCSAQPAIAPMQGHYAGPWHSDGDYHFLTMGYDVELKVVIDGTLDLTVTPDGHVTGTATGKVDAPVYDFGHKDVSSGYGTISGPVSGVLTGGSLLVITHPVIDMHWGTFVGGGYTVERYITMPNYQLTGPAGDCVSASGAIAEDGFPEQYIVADGAGQMAQAPGIGQATGTWQMTSADAPLFSSLSAEVDSFIASANSILASPTVTPSQVDSQVVAPLHALEARITANPTVARCLLERLGAWERSAVSSLTSRALSSALTTLPQLRTQGDLLRVASAVNVDCSLPDGGAAASLQTTETRLLQQSISARDWRQAALLTRELLLWHGTSGQPGTQAALSAGLHGSLQSSGDSKVVLDLARASYVFGDDTDANAAYKRLTAKSAGFHALPAKKKKKGSKKPKAKPTPTPTPRPKSLEQVLAAGVTGISGSASAGVLSWSPVKSAQHYVVTVVAPEGVTWSWSGTATSVRYGDTSLDGVAGSADDGWSIQMASNARWAVLALDSHGSIVGLKLR